MITRRRQAYLKSQDVIADGYVLVTSEKNGFRFREAIAQVLDFVGAGGRNWTDTSARDTGFWVPRVYQFHHAGTLTAGWKEREKIKKL